jgi:uncharacterized membrane protein YhiD involved in acid resistance
MSRTWPQGGGFYEAAVAGTIAIILTLTIFEYLKNGSGR